MLRTSLFCALAILPSILFAQLDVVVMPMRDAASIKSLRVIGDRTLAPVDFALTGPIVGYVGVTTPAKFISVDAFKSDAGGLTFIEARRVSEHEYLIESTGQITVIVTAFDPGLEKKIKTITLGEPPPPPPPPTPPPPPVPDDLFGNIGKRAFEWSAGLAQPKDVAQCYREVAKSLRETPSLTVNAASEAMVACRSNKLGPAIDAWKPFIDNVFKDLSSRWPLDKGSLADFYDAVAVGLEAR